MIKEARHDPEAFGLLYDKYYQPIFSYILRRTADIELAQDICSNTFFKALKKLGQFQWQGVPFSAWLYRIASNEIANHFRKNKRPPVSLENLAQKGFVPAALSNPEQELIEAQEKLKNHQEFLGIQQKIILLSPKYQEVIGLRFFEKKKIKEICEILGKREGTVKSLLHRGLEKLKSQLEKEQ